MLNGTSCEYFLWICWNAFFFHSGKGCVFSFDPVGSYERETYRAGGSASAMLQPLLDNQVFFNIGGKN